jgi:hypothetical protein
MKSIKIGSIVFYRLSQNDVDFIDTGQKDGFEIKEFEIFPMIVTNLKKFAHPGEWFPRIEGHVFITGGANLWVENVRHGLVDQYGGFPPSDKRNEADIETAVWYSIMPKF